MIHVSRSGGSLGVFDEGRVREGLRTGEFIGTDLGWMEGMSTWRPLSELESFAVPAPPLPSSPLPSTEQSGASSLVPSSSSERAGLPWENRGASGLLTALFATIAVVLTRPSEAFGVMKREGGLGDPLLYALICGTAGAIVSFGFSALVQSFGWMGGGDGGLGALLGLGFVSVFVVFLMPILVIIGVFIAAAVFHVCLMVMGGANRSFETTLRVVSYAGGSANVFHLVPVCGSIIGAVWSIVLYCIGLARAHETDTWRAVAAVFLPVVVCCGGGIFLAIMIPAMTAALQ